MSHTNNYCASKHLRILCDDILMAEALNVQQNEIITNGFQRIKLIDGTKQPSRKWLDPENWSVEKPIGNSGFLTGKINDIVVIDLEIYSWSDDFKRSFVEKFGNNIKAFNTYTVKSPRGGYHLYFKYTDDFPKCLVKSGIDIRSNNGYVVAPGSCIDGVDYEVVQRANINTMPRELSKYLSGN